MENVTLNPPKAKRWVNLPQQPPFPIPIGTLTGHAPNANDWRTFRGYLHGNSVCIVDPSHVETLAMGFFGNDSGYRPKRLSTCKEQSITELPVVTSMQGSESQQSTKNAQDSTEPTTSDCSNHMQQNKNNVEEIQPQNKPRMNATTGSQSEPQNQNSSTAMFNDADSIPIHNTLYLTPVEAFFLSFGLGCLLVTNDEKKVMNLEEMWKRFIHLDKLFVYKYVAYHHFRSKGWIVKSGIKFGTTYVLYKDGPPFYHASYSVLIKPMRAKSLTSLPNVQDSPLTWSSFAGINRITEHVAKELLFCYVIQPTNLSASDLESPECISKFEVQEILIRRWISSEERGETEGKNKI